MLSRKKFSTGIAIGNSQYLIKIRLEILGYKPTKLALPKFARYKMNFSQTVRFFSKTNHPKTLDKAESTASVIVSMSSGVAMSAGLKQSVLFNPGNDLLVAPIIMP